MKKKIALILVTGQDGSYLAEILLKNYVVNGVKEDHLVLIRIEWIIYIKTHMKKL